MGERTLEYQGDSLIRWHISRLSPDSSPPHLCTRPWQRWEGGRALERVLGGVSRAVGIWLGHFAASPCPATTPTALGLALVLPTHDCPSSGKRQRARDGVKQVENTFHSPRDFSTLSVTPFLGDHGDRGCRRAQSLALVGRRVCKPFLGGCWVPEWLSWPVGCQEAKQNRACTAAHKEAGGLPFHRPGIHHLLPSGSPTT